MPEREVLRHGDSLPRDVEVPIGEPWAREHLGVREPDRVEPFGHPDRTHMRANPAR